MSIECNKLCTEGVCNRLSSSVLSMSHACLLDVTDCLLKVCGIDCLLNMIDCLLDVWIRLSSSLFKVCVLDCLGVYCQ